jgi:hypothetical protein
MDRLNEEVKISTMKKEYFKIQYEKNMKKGICINEDLANLVFKWSLETVKQFSNNLKENNSVTFYLSKNTDLENIIVKKEKINKLIQNLNKSKIEKIDIFELLAILPFLVEGNIMLSLNAVLNIFCLENGDSIITACEFGLFIECFFRMIANVVIIEEQIVEDCLVDVIRLDYDDIKKEVKVVFFNDKEDEYNEEEELPVHVVIE